MPPKCFTRKASNDRRCLQAWFNVAPDHMIVKENGKQLLTQKMDVLMRTPKDFENWLDQHEDKKGVSCP